MAFFKKLKKDIGIEEGSEEEQLKEQPKIQKEEKVAEKGKTSPKSKSSDWLRSEGQLAVDVYQTSSDFCIQAPIAGVSPEDIDISIENEMLTIKGERKEPDKEKEKNYFYQECYWGPFSRQIILPEDIDSQKIKANLSKGILTIKIRRLTRVKKRKIIIQAEDR